MAPSQCPVSYLTHDTVSVSCQQHVHGHHSTHHELQTSPTTVAMPRHVACLGFNPAKQLPHPARLCLASIALFDLLIACVVHGLLCSLRHVPDIYSPASLKLTVADKDYSCRQSLYLQTKLTVADKAYRRKQSLQLQTTRIVADKIYSCKQSLQLQTKLTVADKVYSCRQSQPYSCATLLHDGHSTCYRLLSADIVIVVQGYTHVQHCCMMSIPPATNTSLLVLYFP